MGREDFGERSAHDPNRFVFSSVKHGERIVMAWTCLAAIITGSLLFIDC